MTVHPRLPSSPEAEIPGQSQYSTVIFSETTTLPIANLDRGQNS